MALDVGLGSQEGGRCSPPLPSERGGAGSAAERRPRPAHRLGEATPGPRDPPSLGRAVEQTLAHPRMCGPARAHEVPPSARPAGWVTARHPGAIPPLSPRLRTASGSGGVGVGDVLEILQIVRV